MSKRDPSVKLNVRLPPETVQRIEALAAEAGVSKSEIVRRAVAQSVSPEAAEWRLVVEWLRQERRRRGQSPDPEHPESDSSP